MAYKTLGKKAREEKKAADAAKRQAEGSAEPADEKLDTVWLAESQKTQDELEEEKSGARMINTKGPVAAGAEDDAPPELEHVDPETLKAE